MWVELDNEKGKVDISANELQKLQNTIDYMKSAISDAVVHSISANVKLKYIHECNRIHELASELIAEIRVRDNQDG